MQAAADALSLLANIVMAWNTSRMQEMLDRWSNRREVIPPELIRRIAPTRLESINLRGVFRFPVDRYADHGLTARIPDLKVNRKTNEINYLPKPTPHQCQVCEPPVIALKTEGLRFIYVINEILPQAEFLSVIANIKDAIKSL